MAARTPTHPPVPETDDRAIDGRGRIWRITHRTTDPCTCLWQVADSAYGGTWAHLNLAHGPVLTYHSTDTLGVAA